MTTGRLSEADAIRTVVLGHPRDVFRDRANIDRQWRDLNYLGRPDYRAALRQYERFSEILAASSVELSFVPAGANGSLDAIYVRDSAIVGPKGAILCNMGKRQRRDEPAAMGDHLRAMGVPIHGLITGDGRLEGGDVLWFDDRTVAVGRGYRTNDEGIRQLRALLADSVDEPVVVPLPHWRGADDVFHLMSIISPVDHDLALVYAPLMPVPFREWLQARGMRLVEVPDEEFASMACNVLALAPRRCLMLAGNPRTRDRLEREGVEVHEYEGDDISLKGGGGPTCLTRPIVRG